MAREHAGKRREEEGMWEALVADSEGHQNGKPQVLLC